MGPYKELYARQEVEIGDFEANNPLQLACNKMRELGFNVGKQSNYRTPVVNILPDVILSDKSLTWFISGKNWSLVGGRKPANRAIRHCLRGVEIERVEARAVG